MLVITLGDPLSVNIELLIQLLPDALKKVDSIVLVGSKNQWSSQLKGNEQFDILDIHKWSEVQKGLSFMDVGLDIPKAEPKKLTAHQRGLVAVRSLELLRTHPNLSDVAVLTCPIDKAVCQEVGFSFGGQTEFFADLAACESIMLLAGPRLKVGLVTNHLPLSKVSQSITSELIVDKFKLLKATLENVYGITEPRIAVVGMNPHCGDNGLFGMEEKEVIQPAIDLLRSELQLEIDQAVPADTAFFHAFSGQYDAVLAMYHDQGLGPLKLAHFFDAVNITGGLPFLRVSPDHGPAANLYGLGKANISSFQCALDHCVRYLGQ